MQWRDDSTLQTGPGRVLRARGLPRGLPRPGGGAVGFPTARRFRERSGERGRTWLETANDFRVTARSVYPSAAALATTSVAILLAAPGRLSMTNGWPSRSDSH